MAVNPDGPVSQLKGVGPKLEQTLTKIGVFRLFDLLLHLPARYQDRTQLTPTTHIRAGDECLVQGQIVSTQVLFGKRRSLKVSVQDDYGRIHMRLFHFSKYQQQNLSVGTHIRLFGEFRFFGKELTVAHPEYELFDHEPLNPEPALTPVYPTTAGLAQNRLRKLCQAVCELDWSDHPGTPFAQLKQLHLPPGGTSMESIEALQADVAKDELTAFFLVMKGRALAREKHQAVPLPQAEGLGRELARNLPFRLTSAQARVISEVLENLSSRIPMLRLVQGDVGSGKTIVAAFAAIRAAEHGAQTAIMAPTELLAEQHALSFSQWLTPLGLNVTLLTGQLPAKVMRSRLEDIASGHAHVVIGTHALFQEKVTFHKLALSIIDEQHRFGVHQRMALRNKSGHQAGDDNAPDTAPHQLIMTATPIPRTLTMALYADMDVSVIDELPKGRQPIKTHVVDENRRPEVVEQLHRILASGQQAYWVCTLIDESEELDATAATTLHPELTSALPKWRVGLVHGRMKSDQKTQIMNAFKEKELDLLIATTVIEVGVDVPNATHMIIENAERLGLSQLHQLRGRVGRGSLASHCYLFYNSQSLSAAGKVRLRAMRDSQDGFYLAEQDLKLRGPGDILGTRQAGEQGFRVADLGRHAHLMPEVIQRGDLLLKHPDDELRNLLYTWAPADTGHLTV
ncbi:MAG: ATP-dependent DNA helicase RecG [Pseudomonadota bacterium]